MEHGGEVHRLVEVALARGAVAAEREHHGVLAAVLRRLREPDRVQELGRERSRLRGDAVRAHVVARVPVALEEHHRLSGSDAAGDHGDRVAVRGEEPVGVAEHHRRGHLACLLTV